MVMKQIGSAVAGGAETEERGEGGVLRKDDGVTDVGVIAHRAEDRCDGCCSFSGVRGNKKVVSPVMFQQKDGRPGLSLIDIAGNVDNGFMLDGFFAESDRIGFCCCCSFMEYEEWGASHLRW